MKDALLYIESYKMGREAFLKGLHSAPALNQGFIDWLNGNGFNSWETKIHKMKIKLYKCYSYGWNAENLRGA